MRRRCRQAFARYELHAVPIGRVIDEPVIRASYRGEPVCEVPGRALADDAPRYVLPAAPPADLEARRAERLDDLAAAMPDAATLLALLGSPNVRSRRPVWRRYDHMNGTNTLVGPGSGDAAVLRLKGTPRALALSIDGPGRLGALDPRLAGAAAVLEGALNVACSGAEPIGITDCLNFGSPETPEGYWQLAEAMGGMADACRALGLPIVSGNVSLYNETPDGPILPTPVVGTVGLLHDRSRLVPMRWREGHEIWLLGEPGLDPSALAASELAWRSGRRGGTPHLEIDAGVAVVQLLVTLAGDGVVAGAHDLSVGGLGGGPGAHDDRIRSRGRGQPAARRRGVADGGALRRAHRTRPAGRRARTTRRAWRRRRRARAFLPNGSGRRRVGSCGSSRPGRRCGISVEALASAWETPF